MVITRTKKIYYPRASQRLQEIQDGILQVLYENKIEERIIYPITSTLDTFDSYDDIKKEYLVDFSTSEEEEYVFNPEYYTVIKEHSKGLQGVKDQIFYYIQNTLSYTSVERKHVKEDLVIGFCVLNPSNRVDSWALIAKTFSAIGKEIDALNSVHFKDNGTIECAMDGVLIGFGKKGTEEDNLMEAHYSITDIYSLLSKQR